MVAVSAIPDGRVDQRASLLQPANKHLPHRSIPPEVQILPLLPAAAAAVIAFAISNPHIRHRSPRQSRQWLRPAPLLAPSVHLNRWRWRLQRRLPDLWNCRLTLPVGLRRVLLMHH
uniref:(northern house mosquito) hypothetical protein n=1 Tax=Culex pipiens TaxID=7175 RepID=A0A8D8CNV3_CULPI